MAVYVYLSLADIEGLGPARTADTRAPLGDWDDGYGWADVEWHKARREEQGYLLPEGMLPSTVTLKCIANNFPIFCTGRLTYGVSQSFRDVIERFEPGLHQFIPFQLLDRNKVPIAEPYYFMNVMTCLDGFLINHSAAEWVIPPRKSKTERGDAPYVRTLDQNRLALSRPKIAGKHLWISPVDSFHFVSEDLYSALVEAGFKDKLYEPIHYEELDIAWDRVDNRGPWDKWAAEYVPQKIEKRG